LAISASALIQTILLYSVWNRRSKNMEAAGVYRAYFKAALAGSVIGAILWLVRRSLLSHIEGTTLISDLAVIAVVSGVFVLLTGLWGWLFKVEAVHYLIGRIAVVIPGIRRRA
jgi:putative peptidoglycan lipid II flippase